jgi:hypothetical protein
MEPKLPLSTSGTQMPLRLEPEGQAINEKARAACPRGVTKQSSIAFRKTARGREDLITRHDESDECQREASAPDEGESANPSFEEAGKGAPRVLCARFLSHGIGFVSCLAPIAGGPYGVCAIQH